MRREKCGGKVRLEASAGEGQWGAVGELDIILARTNAASNSSVLTTQLLTAQQKSTNSLLITPRNWYHAGWLQCCCGWSPGLVPHYHKNNCMVWCGGGRRAEVRIVQLTLIHIFTAPVKGTLPSQCHFIHPFHTYEFFETILKGSEMLTENFQCTIVRKGRAVGSRTELATGPEQKLTYWLRCVIHKCRWKQLEK